MGKNHEIVSLCCKMILKLNRQVSMDVFCSFSFLFELQSRVFGAFGS